MPTKPFLFSDDRSAVDRFDPYLVRDLDPSRVPGYSEIVKANDIARADDLEFRKAHEANPYIKTKEDAYKSIGAAPRTLEVEFKWLPVSGVAGSNLPYALRGQSDQYRQQGFQPVLLDLSKNAEVAFGELFPGYGFPPTAHVEADGTIRRGPDVALYVRSGEVARRWAQYELDEAARRENASHKAGVLNADGESAPAFGSVENTHAFLNEKR